MVPYLLTIGLFTLLKFSAAIQDQDWQPLIHGDYFGDAIGHYHGGGGGYGFPDHGYSSEVDGPGDQCALYKVGFTQDLYFQYIRYKTSLPDLKEFTLCYWAKFTNHSNDHPIFSYAVDGQPKAIYAWISNTERSSYFSLALDGQTFYRLNYPLRLNRWYHTCQSWNGKTGEWQIWVDAERVGRGFNNRLVGHKIPSGGIAITGQVQSQLGGGFQEGKEAPKGSGGILGEITMVQLYNVALTAGKAHKDHKHHHAHQYDHDGNAITTPAPTTPSNRPQLPTHPLLTGGQLNRGTRINFATGQQPQIIQGQEYNVGYANGQLVGGVVTQQLTKAQLAQLQQQGIQRVPVFPQQQQQFFSPPQRLPPQQPQQQALFPQGFGNFGTGSGAINLGNGGVISSNSAGGNPANVQFVDNTYGGHVLFKRQNDEASEAEVKEPQFGDRIIKKRETEKSTTTNKQKKRELFVGGGTILDDQFSGPSGVGGQVYQQSLLYGLAGIGENKPILRQQKQSDEREPAEAEVKAVMNVCSGCDPEPFDKALVFGWRTVPKKLFSGAFYSPAVPRCKAF
ncbi:uncharacterized protein LOC115874107 [Sitophilus oryzae]|uniref:Uncharacterized protein LOC115874107 n=1 Tax=Sitophilus oryzae TaxID=7048 RepID=A0A6J2X1E8_SITOR|nr:uncharacterized protein LOC115874107 [Sitophilus oryzae]